MSEIRDAILKLTDQASEKEMAMIAQVISEFFGTDNPPDFMTAEPGSYVFEKVKCSSDDYTKVAEFIYNSIGYFKQGEPPRMVNRQWQIRSTPHMMKPQLKYATLLVGDYKRSVTDNSFLIIRAFLIGPEYYAPGIIKTAGSIKELIKAVS